MDQLQQGTLWLGQWRAAYCSSLVEYRRAAEVKNVRATYGRTLFEVADEAGLTLTAQVWDFLILADELGLVPKAGDIIVAAGRRFEVLTLGGEGCWRWSDPYRQTFRVHTKDAGAA